MALYTVLVPRLASGTPQAEPDPMAAVFVKEGFCWPALFFALPWLIFRRLWWVLAGYIIVVAVVGAIGNAVGEAFPGPALVLLHFLFALEANELRRWTLRRHGYRFAAVVEGRGLEEAEIRYFAGLSPDAAAEATVGQSPTGGRPAAGPIPPPAVPSPPPPALRPLGPMPPSAEAGDVVGLFPAPGALA
jgi:hypothetical protein